VIVKNPRINADFDRLVSAARRGDEAALAELVRLTQNRLFRFCVYLCAHRDFAQDLCQETYLKAFKSLDSLQNPAVFLDWLFRIAKNLYLDSVRAQKTPDDLLPYEPNTDEGETPQVQTAIAVQEVLSQFEPEDRMLLIFVEIEERSYSEAAELLSVSEDAVRSRLHRLRKQFLEKWNKVETK